MARFPDKFFTEAHLFAESIKQLIMPSNGKVYSNSNSLNSEQNKCCEQRERRQYSQLRENHFRFIVHIPPGIGHTFKADPQGQTAAKPRALDVRPDYRLAYANCMTAASNRRST
jgi:hypothetical protein